MDKINKGVVFSNDIKLILKGKNSLKYSFNKNGIIIPDDSFIDNLREEFKKIVKKAYGTDITIVSENDMKAYMNSYIDKFNSYPIVSMDDIYVKCDYREVYPLDCTRLSGTNKMISRLNPLDPNGVKKQIIELSNIFKKQGTKEIILLDDVIYSGSVIKYISDLFLKEGITVIGAIAGISSEEGYEMYSKLPLKVNCGLLMSKDVIDEICERDFYYGIPQSGMAVIIDGKVYKSPYVLPFGDPVARASVPEENSGYLSNECIGLGLELWKEMQRLSGREIMNYELPERILNTDYNEGVVKTLKKVLK